MNYPAGLLILYLSLTFSLGAYADEKAAEKEARRQAAISELEQGVDDFEPIPQIRFQVEFFETSAELAMELMADPELAADDRRLRQALIERMKSREVELLESAALVANSGEPAQVENVREYIYPTEYEPAELPNAFEMAANADLDKLASMTMTPPTPTAFETRHLGLEVEFDSEYEGNGFISLRFSPSLTYLVGKTTYLEWRDSRGNADVTMPDFYSLRVNTNVTLMSGVPCFISLMSPKNDSGFADRTRKVFIFVTGTLKAETKP